MSDAHEDVPEEVTGVGEAAEASAADVDPDAFDPDTFDVDQLDVDQEVAVAAAVLESDLDQLARERDEFRSLAQQVQADFENYRKRVIKQQTEHLERASEDLVAKLLPVLDACDAAIGHGASDVEPIYTSLIGLLEKEGLERIDAKDAPFDPNVHEAVAHEEGDSGAPVVSEVLRTGYAFKGRVLRPAMVKVSG